MVFGKFFQLKIPLIKSKPCVGQGQTIAQEIGEAHRGLNWGESAKSEQKLIFTFILLEKEGR
jgi:signal transduction histidine kinase